MVLRFLSCFFFLSAALLFLWRVRGIGGRSLGSPGTGRDTPGEKPGPGNRLCGHFWCDFTDFWTFGEASKNLLFFATLQNGLLLARTLLRLRRLWPACYVVRLGTSDVRFRQWELCSWQCYHHWLRGSPGGALEPLRAAPGRLGAPAPSQTF